MTALEAMDAPDTVKRQPHRPFRQQWTPEPYCTVDPDHPEIAAGLIVARIRAIRRAEGSATYLFVDTLMNAYVVSESRPAAKAWIKTKFRWLVGYYVAGRSNAKNQVEGLSATIPGLTEDLAQHLLDLKRTGA